MATVPGWKGQQYECFFWNAISDCFSWNVIFGLLRSSQIEDQPRRIKDPGVVNDAKRKDGA
jgi:hypothetical protein